ncbi:rRNA (cytosine-C(5))-methyltransferase NOP2C isoform X1 [Trifolium pratense]|uniref:rRNA (cytosine-C(5))-methyltransferase NOP2C isoform X1 n=2 Tax=Trifolium pratense TaxID=57577 RepID=UPI001E694A19|nr:rRNA (cytosine-C(5))-methyltransferase NOP2C isoform X1 [Trifolium pratense]
MKKARDLFFLTTSYRTLHKTPNSSNSTVTATFYQTMQLSDHDSSSSQRYSFNPTLNWNPQLHNYFIKAYGSDHFSRISSALTRPSRYSCIRVNTLCSNSDDVIEKLRLIVKQSLNGGDIEGGDDVVNPLKECLDLDSGPFMKCRIPGLDYVVFVWGSGPHRVDYGNVAPKEVIVSRKCAEAVLRGAQVYIPGIMACSAHVEKGDTVAVSVAIEQQGSDGGWSSGMTRGITLQGSETDPYYLERNGLYIGQGTAMLSRAGMFRVTEGLGVDMKDRVYELHSFHNVLEGEIFLQNLPSIIAAHALDPQMGERILDMCAAPGGKTTAIAILMKDKGEVIATDRSHNKVLDIQKLAAELGLSCIKAFKLDACKSVSLRNDIDTSIDTCHNNATNDVKNQVSSNLQVEKMPPLGTESFKTETLEENGKGEKIHGGAYPSKAEIRKSMRRARNGPGRNQSGGGRVDSLKGFNPDSFDRVLLDAPCSALGLRPRLFAGEDTIESLRSHAKYQRRMFDQAVQLVRPGGVIVYSTCTINPGENEALVRYALDKYKYLSLAPQHPKIGGPGLVGSCEFPDGYVEEWLRLGEENLVQRFDPSSPLDTIGFFIAKFAVGSKDT